MEHSETLAKIIPDMIKIRQQLKQPKKDKEGYGYKYADLPTVQKAIDDAIAKSKTGITYLQNTTNDENTGYPSTTTYIFHSSGEWLMYGPLMLPVKKNDAQGFGSAITYERRYQLSEAFGIASEDDDDGNAAINGPTKGQEQQANRYPNYQRRNQQQMNYQPQGGYQR